MKSVCSPRCYLLLAGLVLALAAGQTALAQPADTPEAKYWIFLSDKLDAAGKTTAVEAGHLTERARQRRLRRGTTPSSSADAPLSPPYLDALGKLGITPLHQSRWLNAVSARLTARQAEAVRALPFVRTIRPVARLTATPEPAADAPPPIDPPAARKNTSIDYGQSLAQLELINAVQPLERGINGEGVLIGFLDTRFDLRNNTNNFSHPSLQHIVDSGRLIEVRDFTEADQQANGGNNQTSWHGTSVTSVAVGFEEGQMVGPAYGAQVLAATTEFGPFERNVEEDNFVRGLEWLESQGVDVVNTSLGYSEFDVGQHSYTPSDLDGDTGITTVAFDLAASLGVVVSSAGNEGTSPWRFITTPADGDSVIAVGSVNASGTRNGFSGVGPTADGRIKPDVAAQGSTVYLASSNGDYNSNGTGTSFSSPIVAAVAAQMLQVNPDLNPIEIRDILRETASQANNPDNLLGWGVIDADAAILRAEELVSTATEDEATIPTAFSVRAPYPNPFTDETVFEVRHRPAPGSRG